MEPVSYAAAWDRYAAGMMSTSDLRHRLKTDEVFAAWCKAKVRAIRKSLEAECSASSASSSSISPAPSGSESASASSD